MITKLGSLPEPFVSCIVSCFNQKKPQDHYSMLCLDHIRKFTDPPYQLIVIDPCPKLPIRDDYKTLRLENDPDTIWLKPKKDPGYTKGMNMGAKRAKGDVLVFIQNDVFVHEGWLPNMLWYIEHGVAECVFPDQVPRDRQYVLESYKRKHDDSEAMKGGRDAGLLMITKDAFGRTGGWNEKLTILAEKDFYERMAKVNVRWTDTSKVFISHIMAGSNRQLLEDNPKEYNRRMKKDARSLNE